MRRISDLRLPIAWVVVSAGEVRALVLGSEVLRG
jgi:hypothetical protein